MVPVSNGLIGAFNALTLLLSIPVLTVGVWLSHKASSECERFLDKPLIALGVFLLLVSLAGVVGACCRVSVLMWAYLLVTSVLIVSLACFTVFAFVVTNRGAGAVVSGRGYKEYRLGDYSHWLQRRVEDPKNWARLRSCLVESKVCRHLQKRNDTVKELLIRESFSPFQWGCCKPPGECGFTHLTPTSWNTSVAASNNSDCRAWKNDPSVLCYNCQSCKAGVLANLKHEWRKVAVVNIVFLLFLLLVYSVGCSAFRNNRKRNSEPGSKARP